MDLLLSIGVTEFNNLIATIYIRKYRQHVQNSMNVALVRSEDPTPVHAFQIVVFNVVPFGSMPSPVAFSMLSERALSNHSIVETHAFLCLVH